MDMYKKFYSFLLLGLCFLVTIPIQSSFLNPWSLESKLNSLLNKGQNKDDMTEDILNFKFTENDINELTGKNCSKYNNAMMSLQKKINFRKGYDILKKDYPDSANNIKAIFIKMLRPNQYKRLSDFINEGKVIDAKSIGELQDQLDFLYKKNKISFGKTFADTVDMVMLGARFLPWNSHFLFSIEMNQLYKQLSEYDHAPFLATFRDFGPGEQILSGCNGDNFEYPFDKTKSGQSVQKPNPYPYLTNVLSYLKILREKKKYDSALIDSLMYHCLLIYNQYTSTGDLQEYFALFFSNKPTQQDIQPPVPENINLIYKEWKQEYENFLNQPPENIAQKPIIQKEPEKKVVPLELSNLLKEEGDITEKIINLQLTQQVIEKIIKDNPDLLTDAQKRINYTEAYNLIDASYKKAINIKTFYEKTLRYSIYSASKDAVELAQYTLDFLFDENNKISPEFAHAMESVLLGSYFLKYDTFNTVQLDDAFKFIISCSNVIKNLKSDQEKETFLNILKTINAGEQCITITKYNENNQENETYDFPLKTSYETRVLDYLKELKSTPHSDDIVSTIHYFIRLYFCDDNIDLEIFHDFKKEYLTEAEQNYEVKSEHRTKLDHATELLTNKCDAFIKNIHDKKRNTNIFKSFLGIGLSALAIYYINKHAESFKKIPESLKNQFDKIRKFIH